MKRPSKMINGRSSSKTRHAFAAEQADAEKFTTQKLKFASLHDEEEGAGDEASHRLRQNPRKNIGKFSSSKNVVNNHQLKFVCNKCGKAFQSSKAMCGHMACHSEKKKSSSNAVAKKMVLMDSESDTESGAVQMWRRAGRKKNDYVPNSKVAKIDVVNNFSSEASGIEQEQEEVAFCLMMLSRDSANWGGLNSIGESSDNNSVVLEDRSIGTTRLVNKNGLSSRYDLNEATEKHATRKIEFLGNFDTGHVRNGVKNVETGVKIRNFSLNRLEGELKSERHLSLKKLKCLIDGDGYNQIQKRRMESYPGKGALNESYGAEVSKRFEHMSPQPSNVYAIHNKQFTATSPYESGQKSLEADAYHSKCKGKGILDDISGNVGDDWKKENYESPVYYKEFGSGQNLACTCKVHLLEVSKDSKCDKVPAKCKQNGIRSRDFIDLNLPAPMEDEEANESMGSH